MQSSVRLRRVRRPLSLAQRRSLRRREKQNQKRSLLPLRTSSGALHGGHSSDYFGTIRVGSPAREFSVLFDTGSGNLLLPSVLCDGKACLKHRRFNVSSSSSGVDIGFLARPDAEVGEDGDRDIVEVAFGTGTASGVIAKDKVCLGSTCARIDFVAATDMSDQPFGDAAYDGIFGLGLTGLSQGTQFNLIDCMVRDKVLKTSIFSVFLGATDAEDSEITFGRYKQEHMSGNMLWVPVAGNEFWQVELDDVAIQGMPMDICQKKNCLAIFDTGTSLLAGPTDFVNTLIDTLNVSSDCSNYDTLPDLAFMIRNRSFSLSRQDYVDRNNSRDCSVSVMAQDTPPPRGPLFILGDPFLRKYYTVYNRELLQIGLALADHGH